MKEIIIASKNKGKIKEVKQILKEYSIISMYQTGIDMEFSEDEETFQGNAIKKAETMSKRIDGKLCMADDSGIEIEYLNGYPGVKTKRCFDGTDRERNLFLLEKLKDIPKEKRKIKFTTAIAISNGNKTICESGSIYGYVSKEIRGKNGFGFDEIFELPNGKTLAELSNIEKNEISARRIALEKIKKRLLEV